MWLNWNIITVSNNTTSLLVGVYWKSSSSHSRNKELCDICKGELLFFLSKNNLMRNANTLLLVEIYIGPTKHTWEPHDLVGLIPKIVRLKVCKHLLFLLLLRWRRMGNDLTERNTWNGALGVPLINGHHEKSMKKQTEMLILLLWYLCHSYRVQPCCLTR